MPMLFVLTSQLSQLLASTLSWLLKWTVDLHLQQISCTELI